MEKLAVIWIFAALVGLTAGDSITPQQTEVTETEGKSVKLTCSYETDADGVELHWYRHHSDLQAPQFILWKQARSWTREYIPDDRYKSETSDTTTNLTITALTLADTALYYCALVSTYSGVDALTFGNPIKLTVRPKDRPNVTPTLHVLTPLAPSAYPPQPADALGPEVCLATDFHSNEGEMIMNVRDGKASANFSKAVLSTKTKTYYFVGFSNQTIHSCELQGVSTNNEADDACSSVYPEKAKLNFYLLVMNGVRVLFTKTLAFNTILTIRGLLV